MKKIVALCLMVFMLFMSILPVTAQEKDDDLPGFSVYADYATQDRIASLVSESDLLELEEKKICILKRSITPVYFADPLEFLEKGTWTIYPSKIEYQPDGGYRYKPVCGEIGEEPKIYVAKAIDYKGNFSCDVEIWLFDKYPNQVPSVMVRFKTSEGEFSKTSFYDHFSAIYSNLRSQYGYNNYNPRYFRYVKILGIESGEYGRSDYYDYGSVFLYKCKDQEAIINLDAYNGLFYKDESTSDRHHVLNNEDALKRFTELKEMRKFELQYKKNIERAEGKFVTFSFESYYTKLTGSYNNNRKGINIIRISEFKLDEYLSTHKGAGIIPYPKAEDLIGTRGDPYGDIDWGIETKGVTEGITETSEATADNETKEPQNYDKVLVICGITCVILIVINVTAVVVIKKKKQ